MTGHPLSDGEIDYRMALRSAARNYNRTLVIAAVLAVAGFIAITLAVGADGGVLFVVGVALGALNSHLVARSLARAVSSETVNRKAIAGGALRRLMVVTAVAVALAFLYQPDGWLVFMGLTVFQLLIMVTFFAGLARQVRRA